MRYVTAILVAILAALVLARLCPARAQDARQDWIHKNRPQCCDHRDCQPAGPLTMTFTGWRMEGAVNVVPFAQVIEWPFAVPYACTTNGFVRCLLMQAGG